MKWEVRAPHHANSKFNDWRDFSIHNFITGKRTHFSEAEISYHKREYEEVMGTELEFRIKESRMIEYSNGSKAWWKNHRLHRLDGPAFIYGNGDKVWYIDGKIHRTDGPAVEYVSGEKYWFLNDELIDKREFEDMEIE
jgi:hypothetical protein